MAKLKDTIISGGLTASGAITSEVPGASSAIAGTVKLSNATDSNSTSEAATPSAVKKVMDTAASKEPAITKNTAFNKNFETNASVYKVAGTAAVGNSVNVARADHVHPAQTSVETATKLLNARTISLSGDASGSVSFDGTANVSISTTVVDNSHNHTELKTSRGSGSILKEYDNGNVVISASKDSNGNTGDLYLGYNTSSNFTKNIRLESPVNWKGSTSFIIDSNGKVDWSALKNIPSAQALGAVPLTGGTMTGPLTTTMLSVSGNSKEIVLGTGTSDTYIRNSKSNKYLQLRDDGQVSYDGKLIYHEGKKPSASELSVLGLSGGTMTGTIVSSVSTGTYSNAFKGINAVINSTASGSAFNMLMKMNSTNGAWAFGSYGTNLNFYYASKATIDGGENKYDKSVTILNESGNSSFPGEVSVAKIKTSTSAATSLMVKRTESNTNVAIGFDGNGTVRYLGCSNGELKFGSAEDLNGSGNFIYHTGKKPSPSDIGAAAISGGKKIFCQSGTPTATATGDIWLKF